MSEIVKVSYNGELSQLLYSFNPTQPMLVAADDGRSDNGNYKVKLQGVPPTSQAVPERVFILMG